MYADHGTITKQDKTSACLSTPNDVIGGDSAVAGVLLFIFLCMPAELQLHFALTTKKARREWIFCLF